MQDGVSSPRHSEKDPGEREEQLAREDTGQFFATSLNRILAQHSRERVGLKITRKPKRSSIPQRFGALVVNGRQRWGISKVHLQPLLSVIVVRNAAYFYYSFSFICAIVKILCCYLALLFFILNHVVTFPFCFEDTFIVYTDQISENPLHWLIFCCENL